MFGLCPEKIVLVLSEAVLVIVIGFVAEKSIAITSTKKAWLYDSVKPAHGRAIRELPRIPQEGGENE